MAKRSAARTQRTCCRRCRLQRRGRQEKARRRADLANAQADERERQRKHRAQKRQDGERSVPLSRAGLEAQVSEVVDEIMKELGQAQRLSQAGLRRRVRRHALKALVGNVVQGRGFGTGCEPVTDRPQSVRVEDC